jgi:hypothetical protein
MPVLRNGGIGTSGGRAVIRFLSDNLVKIFVTFRILLGEDILETGMSTCWFWGIPR